MAIVSEVTVQIEPVEIYSDRTNMAVLRHPGRKFPGLVIQGDDLHNLYCMAVEACSEAGQDGPGFWLSRLRETLQLSLDHYQNVLKEHGIPMPFDDGSYGPQGEAK